MNIYQTTLLTHWSRANTFPRWPFQMYFPEWKCVIVNWKLTEICPMFPTDNKIMGWRRQATGHYPTSDGLGWWPTIYASLGLNEFIKKIRFDIKVHYCQTYPTDIPLKVLLKWRETISLTAWVTINFISFSQNLQNSGHSRRRLAYLGVAGGFLNHILLKQIVRHY